MMSEYTLPTAMELYHGNQLRIAAQGAIARSESEWRILHDGTHGVQCNPEIDVKDQLELAGPGDIAATMECSLLERPGVHFAIAADVWHAHRLALHAERDGGLMACRNGTNPDCIWLNHVGTFGFSSIA
jgi:hypothetical protein